MTAVAPVLVVLVGLACCLDLKETQHVVNVTLGDVYVCCRSCGRRRPVRSRPDLTLVLRKVLRAQGLGQFEVGRSTE